MRNARRAFAAFSVLSFVSAAVILGVQLFARPPAQRPAEAAPVPESPPPPPASHWRWIDGVRLGAPRIILDDDQEVVTPPPPPLDSMVRVQFAAGQLAWIEWASPGGQERDWFRPGQSFELANGGTVAVESIVPTDALSLAGSVSFRYRGSSVTLAWSRVGRASDPGQQLHEPEPLGPVHEEEGGN